jgi:hypothetical protein
MGIQKEIRRDGVHIYIYIYIYIYELEVRASRYENLLKEGVRKKMPQFIKHIIKKQ